MVLFNSNTFITLVCLLFSLQSAAQLESSLPTSKVNNVKESKTTIAAPKRKALKSKASWFGKMQVGQGASLSLTTLPQSVFLTSSVGNRSEILVVNSGVTLAYNLEFRFGNMIPYTTAGLSILGVKANSATTDVSYSYSEAASIHYSLGGGFNYLIENLVQVGLGFVSVYNSTALPQPKTAGITYSIEQGSAFKNYLSLQFGWRLNPQWVFLQSLLHPMISELGTAWILSLEKKF